MIYLRYFRQLYHRFFPKPAYLYNLKIEPNSPSDATLKGPNSLSDITFFKVDV